MTLHWASDKFVRRACSCIVFFSSFWSNLPPPDLSAFMGPPACATLHRSFSYFREKDTLRHPSIHPSLPSLSRQRSARARARPSAHPYSASKLVLSKQCGGRGR